MKRCVSCKRPAWQGKFCSSCGAALREDALLTKRSRRLALFAFTILLLGIVTGWGLAAAGLFRATTNLSFIVTPNVNECAGTYAYRVILTDAAGKGISGQPVLLSLDGQNVEMLRTDQNGRLESIHEIPSPWCGASHEFTASTIGTFKLGPATNSTTLVSQIPSSIDLIIPERVVAGQNTHIEVSVHDARTKELVYNKLVRVWNSHDAMYASTGETGTAFVNYVSLSPGTDTLYATMLPDDIYSVSTSSKTFVVASSSVEEIVASAKSSIVLVKHDGAVGSGIIISTVNGTLILTNEHVIQNATTLRAIVVVLSNGTTMVPSSVRVAPFDMDLAILALPVSLGVAAHVPLDQEFVQGTPVLAIGAPLGLTGSVSQGIVSNTVEVRTRTNYSYVVLQTDAAINPGNSGGGLFAAESGNLLGVNTEKINNTEGLGFAIDVREYMKLPPYSQWKSLY